MRRSLYIVAGILIGLLLTGTASACPVCFGAKDSPMTAGMNTAIIVMLGITGIVLSFIGAFFLMMWKRYKRHQMKISDVSSVDENGILEVKSKEGVSEWNTY